ncbi:MAG: YceI family protein [Bacteroidota bacterium]
MKQLIVLFALLGCLVQTWGQSEELVVFTQAADAFFTQNVLPELLTIAEEEDIPVRTLDLSKGIPAGLTTSPAIVYQSARGRVTYAGRYTETQTLKNFIRTARVASQKPGNFQKEQTLFAQLGRAKLVVPVKITPLQGNTQGAPEALNEQMLDELERGMKQLSRGQIVQYGRTDRAFYLDLHPYLGADGTLYLGVEIYSQFSCIEPTYSALTSPAKGAITDLAAWLPELGQKMEQEILTQLKKSEIGDAYQPISAEVPSKTWEELGIKLPAGDPNPRFKVPAKGRVLGEQWSYGGAIDERIPALQFQFQEPLERYSGEVSQIKGSMSLVDGQIKQGYFEVDVNSMTMGMESLDQKVLKSYLKAKKFPKASFRFVDIPPHEELAWGETTLIPMTGSLKLLKNEHEVPCQTQFTPMVNEAGQPVLLVQAQFALNITDWYGIEGPDGPEPARKTLEFNLNFLLEEK